MKPLVSILIPAYNASEWIAETILSAIAQTWPHKEIIVVDDGSSDQTYQIARRFESPQVRVFRQSNQGAAAARNTAFSLCKGDFIQWLDADDLLAPDKIALQMESAGGCELSGFVISGAWGHFLYRSSRARFIPTTLWCDLSPAEFILRKLEQKIFMQTAVWLVSREITEAAGPWDSRLVYDDDGEYFCRILLASSGVRFVPEAKVYYRQTGTASVSYMDRSNAKMEAMWQSMQLQISYLLSLENSERSRAACMRFLQNYLVVFYPTRPDIGEEMRQTARSLGGRLDEPRLPWKYAWIQWVAGWDIARRAQLFLPRVKWWFLKRWDKLSYTIESSRLTRASAANQHTFV